MQLGHGRYPPSPVKGEGIKNLARGSMYIDSNLG
jgi:hypothetical protein